MHFLEGCLALYAVTGAPIFKDYAERLVTLFEDRFLDPVTGTITEYFDADWHRARGELGRVVEPGHHYEWAWLLSSAARWIPRAGKHVDALIDFAERFGSDARTGLVYDEVLTDGSTHKSSHRLWPNAEALKAHLARFEASGVLDADRVRQILANLFTYYLGSPTSATWIDQLDLNSQPRVDKIPASSLYHVHLALAELARLEPRLRTQGEVPC